MTNVRQLTCSSIGIVLNVVIMHVMRDSSEGRSSSLSKGEVIRGRAAFHHLRQLAITVEKFLPRVANFALFENKSSIANSSVVKRNIRHQKHISSHFLV